MSVAHPAPRPLVLLSRQLYYQGPEDSRSKFEIVASDTDGEIGRATFDSVQGEPRKSGLSRRPMAKKLLAEKNSHFRRNRKEKTGTGKWKMCYPFKWTRELESGHYNAHWLFIQADSITRFTMDPRKYICNLANSVIHISLHRKKQSAQHQIEAVMAILLEVGLNPNTATYQYYWTPPVI
ncbi:hypothetical protein AJ78_00305 [Emergomyces pasteurianus Ep9510]|uniref:Uncharacterized protein n=1 Tax=Emergomyces pasteurianus Ep9510 TaxID=1447872 RepID=A0A1J9QWW6_9EURO|nr:hypothetical protein AJ78_00305 [Emergomyces pasteurianus Ep9510]